jgi:signal transduction histidine kinase
MTCGQEKNRRDFYGAFAFATVVVGCYAQYSFWRHLEAEYWQVAASFILGACYVAFAILGNCWSESEDRRANFAYFVTLCAILTAILFVSPKMRGYFGILVLPTVAQAIFDLRWKGATVVTLYLFGATIGVFGYLYHAAAMLEAAMGYSSAFAFTIVFTIITKQAMTARKRAENLQAELETANAQLRAHAAAAEELATTRERNRLAREIHDGVGHYLTVIKTQLDAAQALLPADPQRAADSVGKAARLAGEALDDVRRSVGTLAADTTRPPLVETLRHLAADSDAAMTLRIEGTPRPLAAAAEHALFRTAQEGLTNVRKHAAATTATLTLDFRDPARVRLSLVDDGRGATALNGGGYGLRGLRERLALLGGKVVAENRPEGRGFALRAEVPA